MAKKRSELDKCYDCDNCGTKNAVRYYRTQWKCSHCKVVYTEHRDRGRPAKQFYLEGQKQFTDDQMFGSNE